MKSYSKITDQVLLIKDQQKKIIEEEKIQKMKKKIKITIMKMQKYSKAFSINFQKMTKNKMEHKSISVKCTDSNMKLIMKEKLNKIKLMKI